MKRKLIAQGTSSLTVSIPKTFAKKLNLKAGDELELTEQDRSLIISSGKSLSSGKCRIDISSWKDSLAWIFIANAYIRGDDEIEVTFGKNQSALIRDIGDNLIGFAIVEQGKNRCVLRDVSGAADDSFDSLLRRIFLLSISMGEDGIALMEKQDAKGVRDLYLVDSQINKLFSFILRILNKRGHADYKKTAMYTTIVYLLEQLSDEYARLYRDFKGPVSKQALSAFRKAVALNRDFYNLFYKYDEWLFTKIMDDRNRIRAEVDLAIGKTKEQMDLAVLYRSKKMAELIVDILKVHIGVAL